MWANIQMLAAEFTENADAYNFVAAALAANSPRSDRLFAAKAAATFTAVQIKTAKQAIGSCSLWTLGQNFYRINPSGLVKTR